MSRVQFMIGGYHYDVTCGQGEEARLQKFAAMIDQKALDVRETVGSLSEVRQLLFAALLLADDLTESRKAPPAPRSKITPASQAGTEVLMQLVNQLAGRLEIVAHNLERAAAA